MVYILLADGFEEIEALTPFDYLKRADINTQLVGVNNSIVVGAHNIKVNVDILLENLDKGNIELLILPGGLNGTKNLESNDKVKEIIDIAYKNSKIAAICAAPSILGHMGYLKDKTATCYPGFEDELYGAKVVNKSVVVDNNIITAKGVGVAQEFSFEIIKQLKSKDKCREVMQQVLYNNEQ